MEIKGPVIRGEQKASRYYGVPTANIAAPEGFDLAYGVYTGLVTLADGSERPAVVCYSFRGTHKDPKLEAHLFQWGGDLYGQEILLEIREKVSDLAPFTGEEAMKTKVLADVAKAKEMLDIL